MLLHSGAGTAQRFQNAESALGLLEGLDKALEHLRGNPNIADQFPQLAQEILFQSQLAAYHAALDAPASRQVEKTAHQVFEKTLSIGHTQSKIQSNNPE